MAKKRIVQAVPLQFDVVHEMPGRMRLRPVVLLPGYGVTYDGVASFLGPLADKVAVFVSLKTGSILLTYTAGEVRPALQKLMQPKPQKGKNGEVTLQSNIIDLCEADSEPGHVSTFLEGEVVRNPVPGKVFSFVLPKLVNAVVASLRAIPYILRGLVSLARGQFGLDVLDASALGVCLLRRDFRALSSIVFFFSLGEFLAYWTRKKSHADLADSLALNITHVWVQDGEIEREVLLTEVQVGDQIIVRAGAIIPVDGLVVQGEALVDQSSMTGEPLPVMRSDGATVYAGTVVAEGEIHVAATKVSGDARINAILKYIEESESAKASIQSRYESIADGIVPYNFLLAGLVYALTRDPMRAGGVLLVDYSCAIRLSTPLTVLSAMQEAVNHGTLVKGGRFLEALAEADAIVLDKTGTLTEAMPVVVEVIPFSGYDRDTVLRLSACLEEHFPHPVGVAVVRAAEQENLHHREEHAKVEFVVAHGIASMLGGNRVLVGSEHFVVEDEKVKVSPIQRAAITEQAALGRSVLYLAVGGKLAGIIAIEDMLRPGMADLIDALRADGFKRVIMLTGDGPVTAEAVACQSGITEFKAKLLPEAKAEIIKELRAEGYTVLMVGDGINDAPALSAADVGAAMTHGADMAREVADIVLTNGALEDLLLARKIARQALLRIRTNFYKSVGLNSLFLVGGLLGLLTPTLSAFLHNASTAVIAVQSMTPILPEAAESSFQEQRRQQS